MSPVQRTVVVRAAGPKWSVRVVPPLDNEDLDRTFDSHKHARGYAGGWKLTRGYRIDDADAPNSNRGESA